MGKKNRKKTSNAEAKKNGNSNNHHKGAGDWESEARRKIRIEQAEEDDNETIRSMRSEPVDESVECDVSVDETSLRTQRGDSIVRRRRRVTWEDLEVWWRGECAPFTRIFHDMVFGMDHDRCESAVNAFEMLAIQDRISFRALRDTLNETAKAHGVDKIPYKSKHKRWEKLHNLARDKQNEELRSHLNMGLYRDMLPKTTEDFIETLTKWSTLQSSYLPSGKFNDLSVGRWKLQTVLDYETLGLGYGLPDITKVDDPALRNPPRKGPKTPPLTFEMDMEEEDRTPSPVAGSANPRPNVEYIKLNLYSTDGLTTIVSLRTTTKLGKLKEKHSKRLGRPLRALVYRYKGRNLKDNETAKELGMKENDVIHVLESMTKRH